METVSLKCRPGLTDREKTKRRPCDPSIEEDAHQKAFILEAQKDAATGTTDFKSRPRH
jgi:hypothetical protein